VIFLIAVLFLILLFIYVASIEAIRNTINFWFGSFEIKENLGILNVNNRITSNGS
jgi:hypothetical protein